MTKASADKTTRARIRDAAIEQIARKGFAVNMRTIAQAAGVSVGLINHHFGSKDGLRSECDDYVMQLIMDSKEANIQGGAMAAMAALSKINEYVIPTAYCMRAMHTGGSVAQGMYEHFVKDAMAWVPQAVKAGQLQPSVNEEARLKLLTLQGFGALQLFLSLRAHQTDGEISPREYSEMLQEWLDEFGLVQVELYTQGLFATSEIFDAYKQA